MVLGTEIASLATRMAARLDDLGPELSQHIMAAVPELPDDPEMRAATEANAIAHIGAMAALLRFGIPPQGIEAPAQATEFARRMVHRGVGLPTLLRCYHVGQAKLWSQWMDVAFADVHDPEDLKALVTWSTDFVSSYLDAVRERVVIAYEDERVAWERSREAAREDAIRALLEAVPEDSHDTSRRLRHELRRHHVAAILRPGPSREPERQISELEAAAAEIAAALASPAPLLMRAADGAIWSWASMFEPPSADALAVAAQVTLPAGCRGAMGACGHGAEGFRESHLQARQALRAARDRQLVAFQSVGLASALLADGAAARRFASAELAALDDDSEAAAGLRETLEVYLAEGASHKRAALRLGVHEKTVVHRVRRAEELLGRPLTGRRTAVEAALMVRRLLPPG